MKIKKKDVKNNPKKKQGHFSHWNFVILVFFLFENSFSHKKELLQIKKAYVPPACPKLMNYNPLNLFI